MKESFKTIFCVLALAFIGIGAYNYQDIRVAFPLVWHDETTSISVDTTSTGGVVTKYELGNEFTGYEAIDKHFFRNDLTANTNHTHDANGYRTTINELGGWDMYLGTGVIAGSLIELDSGLLHFQTLGTGSDIQFVSRDDILFAAGLSTVSYLGLYHDQLTIGCETGVIEIEGLIENDNTPTHFISQNESNNIIYKTSFYQSTYEPTFTFVTNIDDVNLLGDFYFTQIGNEVRFSGAIEIDPSGTGACLFEIDLPLPSDFVDVYDATGSAVSDDIADQASIRISANAPDNSIKFGWYATEADVKPYSVSGQYRIK
jgi:hypothetical protein